MLRAQEMHIYVYTLSGTPRATTLRSQEGIFESFFFFFLFFLDEIVPRTQRL